MTMTFYIALMMTSFMAVTAIDHPSSEFKYSKFILNP